MQYVKDQIKHALANQEELIRMFAAEPEKKLTDRLSIIHLQSVLCEQEKDMITAEYLEIMRRIIIEARLYKWGNNIPDELNEMEGALAEMNLMQEKYEHRKKLLAKLAKPVINPETQETVTELKKEDNIQLGLF